MSNAYYHYPHAGSMPVNVPGKMPQQYPYAPRQARAPSMYSELSASPPESAESVSSSGAGLYSSGTRSYAASIASSDYDSSSTGASSVDLLDYMNNRLADTYNPMPMDKNLVRQAQMSGELNAKNRELLELQAEARRRLARTRANFAEGMKAAKEVQRDLQWTQQKVNALNARAAYKYPEQYRAARAMYPAQSDY